ncbi:MAG: ABC transporter substrate-binding protein [Chloroflexi bacterium]|nr:MAG: ABC transporter substrate-binding protein [Chloroflexota bacterium]
MALAAAALVLAACGSAAAGSPSDDGPMALRLGYFPNLTHAPALAGLDKGFFAGALGSGVTLETHTFNAGGDAVTAILSNSIDAAFVGPNPTVNAYTQSHGKAVRVIAGATSGGALLVVKPSIKSVADLKGKKIADPQLGATQDVALRWFLKSHGFKADTAGGGDVGVLPQENSQTLTAFKQGQIDGAWVPEPWASRLIIEGGAKILLDERDVWPQGRFVTTNLIVRTDFLQGHPKRIKALLEGLYQAVTYLNSNPTEAQALTNDTVAQITGKKLASGVVSAAWSHLAFTIDPLAPTLKASADHAHSVGLLPSADLKGLYELGLLNQVLVAHQQPVVSGL